MVKLKSEDIEALIIKWKPLCDPQNVSEVTAIIIESKETQVNNED
jgi:hypothetical protein